MRRGWVWFGVAVLVSMLAGASLAWFTHHPAGGRQAAASSTSRAAQAAAPPLTASQASTLLTRLTSGNSAEVSSAIVMPSGQQVPAATVRGLKKLAPVTADISSFRELSPALATLAATDRTGTKWLLHLVLVKGAWLVLDSVKQ